MSEDYEVRSVEELRELARERNIEGRSKLTTKDALVEALSEGEEGEDDGEATVGFESEASDPDNPEVEEALAEREEFHQLSDEEKELSDLALDASGPLLVQSPFERPMTGAVSEEQAEEQEAERAKLDDDFVGELPERVSEDFVQQAEGEFEAVDQRDVVNFPAPVAEREEDRERREEASRQLTSQARSGSGAKSANVAETQGEEQKEIAVPRVHRQRAVLYTDGLSGVADANLERAYRGVDEIRGGLYEGAFDKSNPRDAEIIEAEEERLERVPDYEE